ncbi:MULTISPECIES: thermonuclease family protein [Lysinibacillus]|uniref:thermonuclease family protein n=1 Tax=Lysinibacillus TaxID=400634 RepID=UPI001C8B9BBC|nr:MULTISPECIES: thermonuclease family protein [Lysinibacillus]WHP39859.1 thermonuclease family protein [Lysinibacillus boronitolerans]MBX8942825.1 thermonuclease family protein [Lysinibacillus sp. K60]UNT54897.1 thermonuclease family protein [Lysinibacillus capsici]UUV25222.1 thermonuclease family protein [Lysinibacillus sp. FN11]UYB48093.1 thermonuclease family protein [Lysinibacillus capsici]
MKMQDIKTLITSGTIILAVALYMIFGRSPAEDQSTKSVTEQQGTITIEQVEGKTGNKRFEIDYIKAYDGDTIQATINGEKQKIRLLMVDTPEMNYNKGGAQPYAEEAKEYTINLLEQAKKIEAVYDVGPETDNYDRHLAYVFVDNVLLQESLLNEGLAVVRYIHKPNNTFEEAFRAIQQKAQDAKLNIWSHEDYFQKDGFHPDVVQ